MKIGIFAYNFEHKKTQEGLMHLFLKGVPIDCILAADPVRLSFYQSKIRISPKDIRYIHPSAIAEKLNIPYHVVDHNSEECASLVKSYDLDIGLILGARILREQIIRSFKLGVLNLHPGLLPENRGLDNIKWAILKNIKQGVTTHLIDKYIDKGSIVMRREVNVYEDDSLIDLFLRIQGVELELMIQSLNTIKSVAGDLFTPVVSNESFKAVPADQELDLIDRFQSYKKSYHLL